MAGLDEQVKEVAVAVDPKRLVPGARVRLVTGKIREVDKSSVGPNWLTVEIEGVPASVTFSAVAEIVEDPLEVGDRVVGRSGNHGEILKIRGDTCVMLWDHGGATTDTPLRGLVRISDR